MEIAAFLATSLEANTVVSLRGDLGAGKTTFVKGLAKGLGIHDEDCVASPTFSYLNIYDGRLPLFHFDLYRLTSAEGFEMSGFQEYFQAGGISCIEWPEFATAYLPQETVFIDMMHYGTQDREIVIRRN